VIFRVPDPAAFDRNRIRAVIELQRPAHTTYALFVLSTEDTIDTQVDDEPT
jgi:hypothetical protein